MSCTRNCSHPPMFPRRRPGAAAAWTVLLLTAAGAHGGAQNAAANDHSLRSLTSPLTAVEADAWSQLNDLSDTADGSGPVDADTRLYLQSLPAQDVPLELRGDLARTADFVAPEVRSRQMVGAFFEHFELQGYRFEPLESCPGDRAETRLAGGESWTWPVDTTLSPALGSDPCLQGALDRLQHQDTYLLLDLAFGSQKEGVQAKAWIQSDDPLLPMDRASNLGHALEHRRDRQVVAARSTSGCADGSCNGGLKVRTSGDDMRFGVQVLGAFVRDAAPNAKSARSTGFVNGGFSDTSGGGWTWRDYDSGGVCTPGTLLDRNPSVSTARVLPNSPHAALLGGYGSNSQATKNIAQISQTVQVPFASNLSFGRRLFGGKNWLALYPNGQVSLRVFARDLTTGQTRRIYSETLLASFSNPSTSYQVKRVNAAGYGGHSVVFTFRVCDPFHDGGGDRKGSAALDDIRFTQRPIQTGGKPRTGLWFDPNKNGQGLEIQKSPNGAYVIIWYTFEANGRSVWYTTDTRQVSNGVWTSPLLRSTWNASTNSNTLTQIGSVRFEVFDSTTIRFYYDFSFNGSSTWDGIAYYTHLHGGSSGTGMWYDPTESGWGVTLSSRSNAGPDHVATFFVYQGSQPVWLQGSTEQAPSGNRRVSFRWLTGSNLCPLCTGIPSFTSSNGGSATFDLGFSSGTLSTDLILPNGTRWTRGPRPVSRLTLP